MNKKKLANVCLFGLAVVGGLALVLFGKESLTVQLIGPIVAGSPALVGALYKLFVP